MLGSARKTSSNSEPLLPGSAVPFAFGCANDAAQSDFNETGSAGSAELGINPSCKHFRHHDSKSLGAPASCGRFAGILPASSTRSLPLPVLTAGAAVPACPRQYSL